MTSLNILLVGFSDVGKSCFMNRHFTGRFSNKEAHIVYSSIPFRNYMFDVRESNTVIEGFDVVWVMFDLTKVCTFENATNILKSLNNNKVILLGNKADMENRCVSNKEIRALIEQGLVNRYYDVSAKSNYNFEKPFSASIELMEAN